MALGCRSLQLFAELDFESVFRRIEHAHRFAGGLVAGVAENTLGPRIPGRHVSIRIQQEERVIPHPGGNIREGVLGLSFGVSRPGLVAQHQEVAHR